MSYEIKIRPRVSETDMMGHINNVSVVAWLEEGRSCLLRELPLGPGRRPPFILRRIEVDYRAQLHYGTEVRVQCAVERIGNTSAVIAQEIRQGDALCVTARSVVVHFDHESQQSLPLPAALRAGLARHLLESSEGPA